MPTTKLSEQIKQRRVEMKLKQIELAEQVGITRQYMCELEKGKYVPGVPTLTKLAQVLKLEFRINKKGVTIIEYKE
jgi:DNA-binding XRE family transcriptional regulator